MRVPDFRELLKASPFEPFRVHVSDGSHYDVRHPDLIVLFTHKIHVLVPAKNSKEDKVFERFHQVSLVHITRIEPIEVATSGAN